MPFEHTSINLQDLMRVLCVADHGSINRAAQHLHVAQPALTRTVRAVEDSLGVQVFKRGARGVTLTADGETLIAYARGISAQTKALIKDMELRKQGRLRNMTIGIVPIHSADLLSRALVRVRKSLPSHAIAIEVGSLPELLPELEAGSVDFIFGPLPDGPVRKGLAVEVLYHEELCIVCGRSSALYRRRVISPGDLAEAQWIIGPEGSPSRERMHQLCQSIGIPTPEIAIEVDAVPLRRALAIHSGLTTVFQRSVIHAALQAKDLRALPLKWPQNSNPIGLTRLDTGRPGEPAAVFAREVRAVFGTAGLRG